MLDSSTTSSATKICASQRTASAMASDGRESISSSFPSWTMVIRAKYVFSRSSVTVTLTTSPFSSATTSVSRSWVIGRGGVAPWRLHEDGGGLCMADPDREEAILVRRLEENDRLLADGLEAHAVESHLAHPDDPMLVSGKRSPGLRSSRVGLGKPPFTSERLDVARRKARCRFRRQRHGRSWTRTRGLRLIRAAL